MRLDTDRWAVLSGLTSDKQSKQVITESNSKEEEELIRLKMIIREEVQAVMSELKLKKDLDDIENAKKTKTVTPTMGFQGPGFGGAPQKQQTPVSHEAPTLRPTHGLLGRGFGF